MRSLRYLNGVLTVIGVLLMLQLWTTWTGGSASMAAPAMARSQTAPTPGGIPNAGAQRRQMVDMLKRISQQTEVLTGLFRTGQARVRVEASQDTKKKK